MIFRVFIEQVRRNHRLNHMLQNSRAQLFVADSLSMLRRNDDRIHAQHLAVRVVFNGDLDFPSGRRKGSVPFLRTCDSRMVNLCAKEIGVGINSSVSSQRIPKHHSLVAGAAGVYAHGYVAGLFVDAGDYGAGVAVEAVEGVVVADGPTVPRTTCWKST